MPTIACRAFGVPGCLDQLNYKKPDICYGKFSAFRSAAPRRVQPFVFLATSLGVRLIAGNFTSYSAIL
jgi:hypothetical protein